MWQQKCRVHRQLRKANPTKELGSDRPTALNQLNSQCQPLFFTRTFEKERLHRRFKICCWRSDRQEVRPRRQHPRTFTQVRVTSVFLTHLVQVPSTNFLLSPGKDNHAGLNEALDLQARNVKIPSNLRSSEARWNQFSIVAWLSISDAVDIEPSLQQALLAVCLGRITAFTANFSFVR